MFVLGTASNSLILKALNSDISAKKTENNATVHWLLLKEGREVNHYQEKNPFRTLYFQADKLRVRTLSPFKEYMKQNRVLIVQNTFNHFEYVSIYRAALKYSGNVVAFLPDETVLTITNLFYFKTLLISVSEKIKNILVKTLFLPTFVLPMTRFMRKRALTGVAVIFWRIFNSNAGLKKRVLRKLSKLKTRMDGNIPGAHGEDEFSSSRFLLSSLDGIGNSVNRLPVAGALRSQYPRCRITVVVEKKRHAIHIWQDIPGIDKLIEAEPTDFRPLDALKLLTTCGKQDIAVGPYSACPPLFFFLAVALGCQRLIAHDISRNEFSEYFDIQRITYDKTRTEADNNLELIKPLISSPEHIPTATHLPVNKEENKWAQAYLFENELEERVLVGIHAGSLPTWNFKRWPALRFARVARELNQTYGAIVLLFGTPSEKEANRVIKNNTGDYCIDLTGQLPLNRTIALIARCRLFISNDSGLMHIANALGIPLVALFGPTNPIKNRPYNQNHMRLVKTNKPCAPCQDGRGHFKNRCDDPGCMESIAVGEVLKEAMQLLG